MKLSDESGRGTNPNNLNVNHRVAVTQLPRVGEERSAKVACGDP